MIQSDQEDIEQEVLIACLSKWHPKHKAYTVLELIELELRTLKDNLLNKSKHGQWEGLRRKLGFMQEESVNLIQQSQSFLSQLQKSLKTTERQCNKRMQKIEKECLHREIKIKSMLDQQILMIVEENKHLQVSDQQLEPYLKTYKQVGQKLKQQRVKQSQFILKCQLQIQQLKNHSSLTIKQIKKKHQAKMIELKKKLHKNQEEYSHKLNELKAKREYEQKHILEIIENKIKRLLKI